MCKDEQGRAVVAFIQVMEIETSRFDEFSAFMRQMQKERGAQLLSNKATVTRDRDRPNHYVIIVEFDSYEVAMKNSNDPTTQRYASEMQKFLDGPITFHNLEVDFVSVIEH